MEQVTKAWRESADARSFVKALEASGYLLARGDRRSYVVVDLYGEIHSLSRQLAGVKSKDLKARLAAYDIDKLPTAAQAQDHARERRQALLLQTQREERERTTPGTARQQREALQKAHGLRRAELEAKRQQLAERHAAERKALSDLQSARTAEVARDRAAKQPKGLLALLGRITGFSALTAFRQSWQDRKREKEYRLQTAALARRHEREMENFKHQERGLTALEKRERRSLETGLRREVFRTIAAPAKLAPVRTAELTPAQRAKAEKSLQIAEEFRKTASPRQRQPTPDSLDLTPEQRARIAEFKRTAADLSAPAREKQRAATGTAKKPQVSLSPPFNEAARAAPATESLSAEFKERAAKPEKTDGKKQAPSPSESLAADSAGSQRLRDIKENAADLTAAQRKALNLAKEFRERAGQAGPQKERDQEGHEQDSGREKHYRRPPPDFSLRR